MKSLKSPIIFTGSKAREIQNIDKAKPKSFNKVVDVFGGGGSVSLHFLQSMKDIEVHYNDKNQDLFQLFSSLKDEKKVEQIFKEIVQIPVSFEIFADVYDKKYHCDPVARFTETK